MERRSRTALAGLLTVLLAAVAADAGNSTDGGAARARGDQTTRALSTTPAPTPWSVDVTSRALSTTPAPTAWSVDVTSPAADEYWLWDATYTIEWDVACDASSTCDLYLYSGTTYDLEIAHAVSGSSYSWTVPSAQASHANYHVKVFLKW